MQCPSSPWSGCPYHEREETIGDVHARTFAAGLPSHHEQLVKAFRALLDKPGFMNRYKGIGIDFDVRKRSRDLLKHCLQRHLYLVRGRLHEGMDDMKLYEKVLVSEELHDVFGHLERRPSSRSPLPCLSTSACWQLVLQR